jgi:hypothetical protein
MYSTARQNSQGRQLSYNVSGPEKEALPPPPPPSAAALRRQHAINPCFNRSSNNNINSLDDDDNDDDDDDAYADDNLDFIPRQSMPHLSRTNTSPRQEEVMRLVSGHQATATTRLDNDLEEEAPVPPNLLRRLTTSHQTNNEEEAAAAAAVAALAALEEDEELRMIELEAKRG